AVLTGCCRGPSLVNSLLHEQNPLTGEDPVAGRVAGAPETLPPNVRRPAAGGRAEPGEWKPPRIRPRTGRTGRAARRSGCTGCPCHRPDYVPVQPPAKDWANMPSQPTSE